MKTSVTLSSESRELLGIIIRQETKTGSLNLSDLQKAYDESRVNNGWSEKRFSDVLSYADNRERIFYVLEKQKLITTSLSAFIERVEKEGITKVLKSFGVYNTKGARHTKSVWCNPYIWVLVAMEMNPMLYAEVITWLTDKLIMNRIEAGNMYKGLSRAVSRFHDVDYVVLAKALNHVIFRKHENGIRNTGTEGQLKELYQLESNLAFAIDNQMIDSFPSLIEHIRVIYRKKYQNLLPECNL